MTTNSQSVIKSLMLAGIVFAITLAVIIADMPDKQALAENHVSTLTSNHEWTFDFPPVETLIQTLVIRSDNTLVLNNHTAEVLESIASTLPETLTTADIERIGFLSQQGFPTPAASEIASTLTGFLRYRQAEHNNALTISDNNQLAAAQARFESSVALQNRYLGAAQAGQLFGEQRQLKQYLLDRRSIQTNPGLSAMERQEMLGRISNQFQINRELENTQ